MASNGLPDNVHGMPLEVQVAVLYERVKTLGQEVRSLKRAIWAFVSSIGVAVIIFLLSVAAGWLGPSHATAALLRFFG